MTVATNLNSGHMCNIFYSPIEFKMLCTPLPVKAKYFKSTVIFDASEFTIAEAGTFTFPEIYSYELQLEFQNYMYVLLKLGINIQGVFLLFRQKTTK